MAILGPRRPSTPERLEEPRAVFVMISCGLSVSASLPLWLRGSFDGFVFLHLHARQRRRPCLARCLYDVAVENLGSRMHGPQRRICNAWQKPESASTRRSHSTPLNPSLL
eukprot:TRINITY_DN1446_c0_g1_i1.p1 TRINITY_DN1446_c0_g1~~TRINITY_DN1446_c0_g1_i1.p1  ORF type:complete len:110 (-),score=11.48 TRINITY_DN1446_c0_g1_i1:33-362(-)